MGQRAARSDSIGVQNELQGTTSRQNTTAGSAFGAVSVYAMQRGAVVTAPSLMDATPGATQHALHAIAETFA